MNRNVVSSLIIMYLLIFLCSTLYGQTGSGNNNPFQWPIIIDDFLVNDDTLTFNQGYPAIAGGPLDLYVIAWTDNRNGIADIYAQRFVGAAYGLNFKVNDDTANYGQASPAIAMDGDGDFVVTWEDLRNGHADIYAQRYSSTGENTTSNTA